MLSTGREGSAITTATILLIRHAAHDHVGKVLSGRMPGLPLAPEGEQQAIALARRLSAERPDVLQSSPVQRARQTAAAIGTECDMQVDVVEALQEVDFGDWTGRSFVELDGDARWGHWNRNRAEASAPGGESMKAAQERAFAHLQGVAAAHPGRRVAMVTHCDIIRAVVAAILGLSLDNILKFDIETASVTRIAAGAWGTRLISLNEEFA